MTIITFQIGNKPITTTYKTIRNDMEKILNEMIGINDKDVEEFYQREMNIMKEIGTKIKETEKGYEYLIKQVELIEDAHYNIITKCYDDKYQLNEQGKRSIESIKKCYSDIISTMIIYCIHIDYIIENL
ncbi:hypothetical protein EDI_311130 [Entamoeba dispar SAW760]|uniref:Uncharacterized protein n=1 Tax=Entamoeba dispar (strain ATCC PRA-260 / SAW760) TaxID=370354 RepID=B0ETN2_ENTDS|nr:uncharacterized protein EDI_311130 [Entamoeba dispar SAW760]EDR22114.1 hypothetical protein EDI_311130 [Entamoeba dispar SAW760]|eukprot:EDR22114.1 hypothetical protein EDI_311130 [Entamoeba dispar SAW760]